MFNVAQLQNTNFEQRAWRLTGSFAFQRGARATGREQTWSRAKTLFVLLPTAETCSTALENMRKKSHQQSSNTRGNLPGNMAHATAHKNTVSHTCCSTDTLCRAGSSRGPRIQLRIWPMLAESSSKRVCAFVYVGVCVCPSASVGSQRASDTQGKGAGRKGEGLGGGGCGQRAEEDGLRCWSCKIPGL